MAYQTRYGRPVGSMARLNNYEVPRSRPTHTRATAPAVALNNFALFTSIGLIWVSGEDAF